MTGILWLGTTAAGVAEDAASGAHDQPVVRAVRVGLPSIAFTEHVDATRWGAVRCSER